jgi:endonuclease/exonuclease/phosphatase (EEP) superfamily protein YafD
VVAHPTPPLDAATVRRRNEHIRALAEFVRDAGRPAVVAGDLNMTMWNRGYSPLEKTAGLHNARAGEGVGPTWPSLWHFGVPLDHILATDRVRLRNFRVLPSIGSDHRPIVGEFALP